MRIAMFIFIFFCGLTSGIPEEQQPPQLVTYYLGLLYKGPVRTQSADESAKIQSAHLQHLESLYKQGALLIAGPMGDDGDLRGIVVLKVKSLEEAQALVNNDPAVKAGRLRVELHPWMSESLDVLRYKEK
ncbi:YciI family protein [bacterium]|nr:YciI family protein [bacterium]